MYINGMDLSIKASDVRTSNRDIPPQALSTHQDNERHEEHDHVHVHMCRLIRKADSGDRTVRSHEFPNQLAYEHDVRLDRAQPQKTV